MDKRFAIPAGLAIMVALAVIGVLSLLSYTATQPAEASIQDTAQIGSARVDPVKLTEPFASPLAATTLLTSANVTISPNDPGAATRFTIPFEVEEELLAGTGEIIIHLPDDDWAVPETMDRSQITITAEFTTAEDPVASDAVSPQSVTVDLVGTENDEPEITLVIPDMLLGDSDNATGSQGIAADAVVTVVFNQSAGIRNPTEGGSFDVEISTSAEPAGLTIANAVFVPILLELSSTGDPRGELISMVAKGVINGTTVTFFRDDNGNSIRESAERVLCRSVASSADIATCEFTIANPPFEPGRGDNCVFADIEIPNDPDADDVFDCNYINAFDGENNFITKLDQGDLDNSIFDLEPSLTASPDTASIGDKVVVSMFDYPGATIEEVTLGGVAVTGGNLSPASPTINATTGQGNFTLTVPATVPLGVQQLVVTDDTDVDQDITINIGGASISLSHTEVIANQDVTISGNGFTQRGTGDVACVLEGEVLFNSVPVVIDGDSIDPSCDEEHGTPGVELSSGGTFTMTVILAQDDDTIPSGLLTEGIHELKVTDTSGAEGTIDVEIPVRTLEVTPVSARPRDTVTIIGRNYIADNTDSDVTGRVTITYDCGSDDQIETVDPDASGNFRETLRIPTDCTIPSTNTITAEIFAGATSTGVVDTVTHEIPDALVRVTPVSGPQGSSVTVSGEGFRTFETVESIEFGGRGSLGGRTVSTDGQGNFTVDDLVIPGMDPGVHSVIVEVGTGDDETTASTSFEVLEASGTGGARTTPIEDALAPLFEGETLDRAFFFNNATKEWLFYINDPAFEAANDLEDIPSGLPLWIRVTEDTTVELNAEEVSLSCINPGTPEVDCWNQIVFP